MGLFPNPYIEEINTYEEYCENLRNQIEELKKQNKAQLNALKFVQSLAKNPNHRTSRTLIQMCSFFDDIVLPIIEPVILQAKGKKS